ncbi:NADPH-dependent glutamate synthase [Candidatus Woesearchaeota archaeon]|nr:NADPH-dependent glutamate synthase [Candidatus Woesearchaeota archaeon]
MQKIARTPMREQEPDKRNRNFDEVNLGYTEEQAIMEAARCLQCKKPQCVEGCPVNIDIPRFINHVKKGRFQRAIEVIKKTNNLPGVCGRVCPQEEQCEAKCILGIKDKPVAIGNLERFAADHEEKREVPRVKKLDKKIAIVGSGPAGLTCAADLALMGYRATIFESLHKPGGVLTYGIPDFRMPKDIVNGEIEHIKKLGVKIELNKVIGRLYTIDELLKRFDAVFIASGAGLPYFMGIEGENLNGVYSANEFLTRVNLMKAGKFPEYTTPIKAAEKSIVVGGGNVAMDSARTAKRLGSDVTIVYRRTINEMPARNEEIKHAKEEGIEFMMLTCPTKIIGEGRVEGIECIQMRLGEEDESGRKRPVPIEGSEFVIKCDQVVIAIGQGPNPLLVKTLKDIETGRKCCIMVDGNMATTKPGVFAGGDAISGSATVIRAMGEGKKAAQSIGIYLKEKRTNP